LFGYGRNHVCAFAIQALRPESFVLDVATFNERARRVYRRAGFRPQITFTHTSAGEPTEFLRMSRPGSAAQ
jgi:RimJ/RimL family protein N-acetyltransferase